ncbi:armadillo-type protein [Blastocladiella britannica]|nr:armadillo-type protein [Blastocladiella britannica]
MLNHDFPDKWPGFIEQVGQYVQQTSNHAAVYGGLLALEEVIGVFQWRPKSERRPLNYIVKNIFPYLLQIGTDLTAHDNVEAAQMLKVIAKTYHSSIASTASKAHQEPAALSGWLTLMLTVVTKTIPASAYGEHVADEEDMAAHPWWKAKKWAARAVTKWFTRYGNHKSETFVHGGGSSSRSKASAKADRAFADHFMATYAPQITRTFLSITEQSIQTGAFVAPRVHFILAQFYANAVSHKDTWAILRPFAQQLVQHVVHPALCMTAADFELWEDEPVEFVNRKVDPLDDYKSPASGASILLMSLATQRRKATFEGIVQFVHETMLAYNANPTEQTAVAKEGALHMLSHLAEHCLASDSPVRDQMEAFLVSFVFPDFASPLKYLRARAMSTVTAFSEIEWAQPEHAITAFQAALALLQDPELPIRIHAALALKPMMLNDHVRHQMPPHVPAIMKTLLELQNQIDMDTLASVMEEMVETFSSEVAPFAVELARHLCNTFVRIMNEAAESLNDQYNPNEDDDDQHDLDYFDSATDKTMAAMGVLKTLQTLVLSVQDSREIVLQLELEMLVPLEYVLAHQVIDLYADVFELVDTCTFALKAISPTMWGLFAKLHSVCNTDAADYISDMTSALDNYISYGKVEFASNPQLQQAIVDMIDVCLTSSDLGEADRVSGCTLIESMLLHLRGSVDHLVPHFLARAFALLLSNQIKTTHFLVAATEVGINALYYDPVLTLRIMEEHQWTGPFFAAWMQAVPKMSRVHDKKLGIIALCSLFRVPAAQLPPVVQTGLPQLLVALSTYLSTLPKAFENRKEQEAFFEGEELTPEEAAAFNLNAREVDDNAADDDEELVDGDDADAAEGADDGWEDDDNELLTLAHEGRVAGGDDDDDESSYDDDEELPEELYFESPLDDIDPYIAFASVFTEIQASNPALYHGLTAGASADAQKAIMEAMQKATENQAKAHAAAAAAAAAVDAAVARA